MTILQSTLNTKDVSEWVTQAMNRASSSNDLETVTQFIATGLLLVIITTYNADPVLYGQESNKAWNSLSAKEVIN